MRGTEFGELSAFLVVAAQRNFTRAVDVSVTGSPILNETLLIEPALVGGVGMGQLPRAYVATAIAKGRVVSLLKEWQPSGAAFALYYPSRRQTPAALQALLDFLRKGQRNRASR